MIKYALEEYAIKHSLIDRAEPRYLLLDEELGRACGIKKPEKGQRMSRDEIMKKLRAGVVWSVSIGGVLKYVPILLRGREWEDYWLILDRKGNLQPITITTKTRQGRKQVTLITGLETFSIPPDEFAEELKKLCAGSTTVAPLVGSSPKLGLMEVMVQGSQVKVVTEALVGRGVPKKWIKEGGK
jgi:translation initiation factor 2D